MNWSFIGIPLDQFWNITGLTLSILIEVGMQFDVHFTVTVTNPLQSTRPNKSSTASSVK